MVIRTFSRSRLQRSRRCKKHGWKVRGKANTNNLDLLPVISGTPEEIKARLLDSVDAFFEIYIELCATPSLTEARNRRKVF